MISASALDSSTPPEKLVNIVASHSAVTCLNNRGTNPLLIDGQAGKTEQAEQDSGSIAERTRSKRKKEILKTEKIKPEKRKRR
jgi:hypothetical protein